MASRVGRFAALTAMMSMERIDCSAASSERGASSAMSTIPLRVGACVADCMAALTALPAAGTWAARADGAGTAGAPTELLARAPTAGSEVTLSNLSVLPAALATDVDAVLAVRMLFSGDALVPAVPLVPVAAARALCMRPSRSACASR